MIFAGCEPTVNTQQITQSAQNLRENVRNIDTQRITQGAQNLKKKSAELKNNAIYKQAKYRSCLRKFNEYRSYLSWNIG